MHHGQNKSKRKTDLRTVASNICSIGASSSTCGNSQKLPRIVAISLTTLGEYMPKSSTPRLRTAASMFTCVTLSSRIGRAFSGRMLKRPEKH